MTDDNEPYTLLARVADAIVNLILAVALVALVGTAGYLYARYL